MSPPCLRVSSASLGLGGLRALPFGAFGPFWGGGKWGKRDDSLELGAGQAGATVATGASIASAAVAAACAAERRRDSRASACASKNNSSNNINVK